VSRVFASTAARLTIVLLCIGISVPPALANTALFTCSRDGHVSARCPDQDAPPAQPEGACCHHERDVPGPEISTPPCCDVVYRQPLAGSASRSDTSLSRHATPAAAPNVVDVGWPPSITWANTLVVPRTPPPLSGATRRILICSFTT